ncbi:unnamed protein product [Rhizoctonia solani]|uniref:Protein kinase domain-containing protein n=1 Tax=Rhizoctonia solani TaxID=456999 RepID=A0A8H3ARD5_9AGAM|nr:unnamed protein product [Rhizoctonia solani]
MTVPEVIASLVKYGCTDVTSSLDLEKCDERRTEACTSGDLYHGVFRDGLQVPLKCLDIRLSPSEGKEQLEHAADELLAWSKCVHPNAVPLIGVAQYGNQLAMVSPWMQNGSLRQYLSTQSPSQAKRLKLGAEIANGLSYLHKSGLPHEVLRARNIFASADGTPVIAEFGASILKKNSTQARTLSSSMTHLFAGWSAPKVLSGKDIQPTMTDVWAVGTTALEIFEGSVPYVGLRDTEAYRKINQNIFPERPEKGLPTGDNQADLIWSLLNQCWALDPSSRPTAADVRDQMLEIGSYPVEH